MKKSLVFLLLSALFLSLASAKNSNDYKLIQNRYKPDQYLHNANGNCAVGKIDASSPSAHWELVPVSGTKFFQIKNRDGNNQYLHIEHGGLTSGPLGAPGWWSAQWEMESVTGTSYTRIRNRWKRDVYIHNEHGNITAGPLGAPGWWSAQWKLINAPAIAAKKANVQSVGKNTSNVSSIPHNVDRQTIEDSPLPPAADSKTLYNIYSKENNWVVDIEGGYPNVGTNIITYPVNGPRGGSANQKYKLVPAGNGYVYIESIMGQGLVLDVKDWGKNDGSNVQLVRRGANGTTAQKWKIITYGDGTSAIQSAMGSNYYLGIADDNRNLVLRVGEKGKKTRFYFRKI